MKMDADRARAKEMFRQMSPKEKRAHIFRYYWLHMLAAVFVVWMAVSIGLSVREDIARENNIYIALQEGYSNQLQPAVEELAQTAGWPEELNFSYFAGSGAEDGTGSIQLVLYLTADQVDFLVCDDFTMRVLSADETLDMTVVPLKETKLGARVQFLQELYVIQINDTARQEKAQQFAPILIG